MMSFIFLIILISLVQYLGDSNFKFYSKNNNIKNLIIGLIAYGLFIFLPIVAINRSNIIFTNGMWEGISTIIVTLIAYVVLHERLNNNFQWAGLILIITGTLLLSFGKIPT